MAAVQRNFGRLADAARGTDWWPSKLPPLLSAFYASFLLAGAPIAGGWREALALLAALITGATYVSVINDLTDREVDRAAGKPNRLDGLPSWLVALLLALLIGAGAAIGWAWRGNPALLAVYAGAWAAFSCYSIPPVRRKTRGLPGLLADAAGAHLMPTLMAVLLAFEAMGRDPPWGWLAAMGLWSASAGVRFIVSHQLCDEEADRASGTPTFVQRHGAEAATHLAHKAAFPLEVVALFAALAMLPSVLPALALAAYLLAALGKMQRHKMRLMIAAPRPGPLIILVDYYEVFLPLSLLLASALFHPQDWIVLAIHCLLFAPRILRELWVGGYTLAR